MIRSTIRGVAASAIGTLAMDASLYRRYRHDGGDEEFAGWESSEGLASWESAPAPALVWKYDVKTLGKDLSAHLVFGTATAAAFCILAQGARR